MANFCENCGSPLKNENKFCPNCGAPVKNVESADPVAPAAPEPSRATQPTPDNLPSSALSSAAATGGASPIGPAAGAAAAATVGAFHPEPAPEKPQEAFVPPQQDPYPDPQPVHEESITANRPTPSSLRQEAEQAFPHSDHRRPQEFARGGTGPKYEPDTDIQSMFLRYDNRLNRKRYIMRALALWAATAAISFVFNLIAGATGFKALSTLGFIISLASAVPGFMIVIRRLHDLDRPGWWCIGAIIPIVNFVLAIYLLFFKGTDGSNQYGPDPLEVQD